MSEAEDGQHACNTFVSMLETEISSNYSTGSLLHIISPAIINT
jgi:hypothetical protein